MEQKTLKKRVAVYCRADTDSGDPCCGLDVQRAYYTQKFEDNPEWELVEIFTDEGLKDTDPKGREGFNRMMTACKRGRVDLILTKSVSHFARNMMDALKTVRHLKTLGVGVIFEKENIHTLADESEFHIALLSHFTQEGSKLITKNLIYPVSNSR